MKRWLGIALLVAAWAIALPALADTLSGVVIVVIDGDTVLFKPDHYGARSRAFLKVRLADIDAPEKDQPYGDVATRALATLVLKQRVNIVTVATDKYGRTIALLQKDALQVNAEMVRLGLAWLYDSTHPSGRNGSESFRTSTRYRNNAGLADAQDEARNAQRGLWAETQPTPPWEWRRSQNSVGRP